MFGVKETELSLYYCCFMFAFVLYLCESTTVGQVSRITLYVCVYVYAVGVRSYVNTNKSVLR